MTIVSRGDKDATINTPNQTEPLPVPGRIAVEVREWKRGRESGKRIDLGVGM